ncbi:MAG: hypothetical protein PVJ57_21350 [Phycisphaerae bacterium]|jgi:hypothetical protein
MFPLADCPVCNGPLHWSYVLRPLWSQWRCPACRSLLGINARRRLLGILIYVPLMVTLLSLMIHNGWDSFLLLAVVALAGLPVFLLVDRPRVIERCGLYCQSCGYDLQGQTVPRCPECGRELSDAERKYFETGTYPSPSRRGRYARLILTITVFAMLLLAVAMGILSYTAALRRPPATSMPTTLPAAGVTSAPASAPNDTTDAPPATQP